MAYCGQVDQEVTLLKMCASSNPRELNRDRSSWSMLGYSCPLRPDPCWDRSWYHTIQNGNSWKIPVCIGVIFWRQLPRRRPKNMFFTCSIYCIMLWKVWFMQVWLILVMVCNLIGWFSQWMMLCDTATEQIKLRSYCQSAFWEVWGCVVIWRASRYTCVHVTSKFLGHWLEVM